MIFFNSIKKSFEKETRSFDVFLDAPEQTVEHTIERPVIWDAIALIMTYCNAP